MEVIHREGKLGKQHHLKKTDSSNLWNMEKSIKRELKTYVNSKQFLRIFRVDFEVNHTKGEITQVSRTTLLALTDFLVFAFM